MDMAETVLYEWSETKSYGDVDFRIVKFDYGGGKEIIAIQQSGADDWFELESFTKGRLMFNVLEKLTESPLVVGSYDDMEERGLGENDE